MEGALGFSLRPKWNCLAAFKRTSKVWNLLPLLLGLLVEELSSVTNRLGCVMGRSEAAGFQGQP